MVAKTPGLSPPRESNTQFSHDPLPIANVLPEVLFCLSWTLSEIDELEYSSPPGVHDVQP